MLPHPSHPRPTHLNGPFHITSDWCKLVSPLYSAKMSLGWWDLRQSERDGGDSNWWPGSGRWKVGFKMEDITSVLVEGEFWDDELYGEI